MLLRTVFVLLFSFSSVTFAQPEEDARALFKEAEAAYKLGRFEFALEKYSRAYELVPYPAFLFNIGQCHRNLGHIDDALFFYESYLRDAPKASNREAVERLIAELQAEKRELALKTKTTTVVITKTAPPPAVHKQWWFWTALGVAVAAVAGGVAVAVTSGGNEVIDGAHEVFEVP